MVNYCYMFIKLCRGNYYFFEENELNYMYLNNENSNVL